MGKVILICGKIGSGKTTYARKLAKKQNAVMIGQDEIILGLFGANFHMDNPPLFRQHSDWVQEYVKRKSAEIAKAGAMVICDNGFWSYGERDMLRQFYNEKGVICELHYMDTPENQRLKNILSRNKAVKQGELGYCFTQDDIIHHFFEEPAACEIDFRVEFDKIH